MELASSIEIGIVLEGTVTGIMHFGAFVLLSNGKTGLVHISEVADEYVRDVKDYLKEQQKVQVKVLSCDERGKIALSIKQADPGFRPAPPSARSRRPFATSFEDKMSRFLKDSEDRLSDLRRVDTKRGGRGGGSNVSD